MPLPDQLDTTLGRLDAALVALGPNLSSSARANVERWRGDVAALRFHLRRSREEAKEKAGDGRPPLVAVIGGTGTGKSTLVNRLLGADVTAASFRRTFTSGPIALAGDPSRLSDGWLGLEHVAASSGELPARGRPGALVVAKVDGELASHVTLVDTPDLDGDQPAHHAQADRVFRWAEAVLFLVTPEKYQMTELIPYYRLARRYGLAALFAMNKCEEQAVLDDYAAMLEADGSGKTPEGEASAEPSARKGVRPFAVPRDDAAYEPPKESNLEALRSALLAPPRADPATWERGLRRRAADMTGRFGDQILGPLREDRREADRLAAALRAMETPTPGVDVNPLTLQLQRRFQQRSILYLIGPQRILDRVRQAPGLLVRLPRLAWDYVRHGEVSAASLQPATPDGGGSADGREVPDFSAMLADQMRVLHGRIDDVLRSGPLGERWLREDERSYAAARIDVTQAAKIAEEELAELRSWLEQRWNATPRDTRALHAVLKRLPGGQKLTALSEAAPYILTVVLLMTGHVLTPVELLVLGGYAVATWMTERMANEVTARARATNARIAERYTALAHDQIERVCAWLDRQAPSVKSLAGLEALANEALELAAG